jgi:hypothetical protein
MYNIQSFAIQPKRVEASVVAAPKPLLGLTDTSASVPINTSIIKMSKIAVRKSFEPKLYYLTIVLTSEKATYKVNALVDTGCAKSAMSKLTYLKLHNQDSTLQPQQSSIKIQTCDGTNHSIMGFIQLNLQFVNSNFCLHNQQIMIVEQLSDEFIIGSDILGSEVVSKIQSPFIYFLHKGKEIKQEMNLVTYPQLCLQAIKNLIYSNLLSAQSSLA